MTIQGRDCGSGVISSQHDRRFTSGLSVDDSAWGFRGACAGPNQPPDMPSVDCSTTGGGKAGAIATTECANLCDSPCAANSFCHCGTAKCECKAGFAGSDCSVDLCAAARCGEHGTCSALYLGDSSALPVTSSENACICDQGWWGENCDDPEFFGPPSTEAPTPAPMSPTLGFCEGKCNGSGPYYGCASSKVSETHTKSACDPSGGGGCQYLSEGQTTSWCIYQRFDTPPQSSPAVSPSRTPEAVSPAPTVSPSRKPVSPAPTDAPSPSNNSCEGKCNGSGPYYGCAWWKMNELHTKSACNPNGDGGCVYLREDQSMGWCIYQTFDQ